MAKARPPKSSKKLHSAPKHDSLAQTRSVPAAGDLDELAQTRETETLSLTTILLDAGEAAITERGFARTTVEDVAKRAGVSLDVFHGHFAGKGALLRALNERFVGQMMGAVDAATATGSWNGSRVRDVVEIAVRSILGVVDERQGLVRAFLAHGATDRALAAGLRKIGAHMTAKLSHVLGDCTDAKSNAASSRTIGFALLMSAALAHHSILVGEDWSGVGFTREEIAEETSYAISVYLTARASS